jgi:hypothetical protein
VAGVDYAEHIALELGRPGSERGRHFSMARDLLGNRDFEQVGQGFIHRAQVLLHNLVTLLAVGVANRLANRFDGLIARQNLGDGEEAGLQIVFMREPMPVSRAT